VLRALRADDGGRRELERLALARDVELGRIAAQANPLLDRLGDEAVEHVVLVHRIVVEEREPVGADPVREREGVGDP